LPTPAETQPHRRSGSAATALFAAILLPALLACDVQNFFAHLPIFSNYGLLVTVCAPPDELPGGADDNDSNTSGTSDDASTNVSTDGPDDPLPDDSANGPTFPAGTLFAESAVRPPIASQCAQSVISCTVVFPHPVLTVEAGPDQTVTPTADGFMVQGGGQEGFENVHFRGSDSDPGVVSTVLLFQWSSGAIDEDPRTLAAGTPFSTEANPVAPLQLGRHRIRLTVTNDLIFDELVSNSYGVIATDVALYDFVEVVVDVHE